jgi:hypothetical protein
VRRRRTKSTQKGKEGVVILLVAVVLLFIVAAMAALAIDLVTFYTARSEAQLAADGAALAGARVLANSGMTSNPADANLAANAEDLAQPIAIEVAIHNEVGGRNLLAGEVTVTFPNASAANPRVSVQVTRTDLPTFFARIWGRTHVIVTASATAEAYNPSGLNITPDLQPPVAPTCVKPWLLPNLDPTSTTGAQIFNVATGAIANPGLLGTNSTKSPGFLAGNLQSGCPLGDCGSGTALPAPAPWRYYPGAGDPLSFPPPTQALPVCSSIATPLTPYQKSVAGCVPTPITCNSIVKVNIDVTVYPTRAVETAEAVNCLTHALNTLGDGDVVDPLPVPSTAPFDFEGGNQNPIVNARGQSVLVSDSLVTVPVIDSLALTTGSTSAQVIGFVQLFLNPDGGPSPDAADPAPIQTKIINMAGCGTNATGQPVLGNGASPVPVRLISAP